MSDILTIEQIPAELKQFWVDEAERNARSLSEELISALEEGRVRRVIVPAGGKNVDDVINAVRQLQLAARSHEHELDDKILYDDDGMPK